MSSFHDLLKEYGRLSAWAAASGAVPFLGALGSLAPPSLPMTIAGITSVAQLVVLVLMYQLLIPTLTNTDSPCPASCRHPRLKMRVKSKMCMIGHRAGGRSRTASLGINPPKKRIVNRVMLYSFGFLIFASLVYGILFRLLTVTLLNSSERIVRGFVCTTIALHQFGDKCPLLSGLELNEVRNRPSALWTDLSLNVAHVVLFTSWVAVFMALAALIGSFVAYQQRPISKR
jgi:hypothetical protein